VIFAFLGHSFSHGVSAISQKLTRCQMQLPRLRHPDVRVFSVGHGFVLAVKRVAPTPELPACGCHPKVKASTVAHGVVFLLGLGLLDRQIAQLIHFHDQHLMQKYMVDPEYMPICIPANAASTGRGWTWLEWDLFILLYLVYFLGHGWTW